LLLAVGALPGCGGSVQASASASSAAGGPPLDRLRAISTNIQAKIDQVTLPLTEASAVSAELAALTSESGLDSAALASAVVSAAQSGVPSFPPGSTASPETQAKVTALGNHLKNAFIGLKQIPDRVAQLGATAASSVAAVPPLVAEIQADSQVALNNPFGSAEEKAKAKANLDGLSKAQADVQLSIEKARESATSLPGKAASTLSALASAIGGVQLNVTVPAVEAPLPLSTTEQASPAAPSPKHESPDSSGDFVGMLVGSLLITGGAVPVGAGIHYAVDAPTDGARSAVFLGIGGVGMVSGIIVAIVSAGRSDPASAKSGSRQVRPFVGVGNAGVGCSF
jgi:hypothetical protein